MQLSSHFAKREYFLNSATERAWLMSQMLLRHLSSIVGEFSEAEKAYRRAIQFKNAIDDVKGVASSLNNLGAAWIEQGKGGKAISALV